MGFGGNLDTFNLADILQTLAMNRQSGALAVTGSSSTLALHFSDGNLCFVEQTPDPLPYQNLFRAHGVLSDTAIARVTESNLHPSLADFAAEATAQNTPVDGLRNVMRFRMEEAVYDLFLWEHASFEFQEAAPLPPDALTLKSMQMPALNIASLLMEAARRVDEWSRIQGGIPSQKAVFSIKDAAAFSAYMAQLEALPQSILALIDGQHTVASMIRESCRGRFAVAVAVAGAIQAGVILECDEQTLAKQAEVAALQGRFGIAAAMHERLVEINPTRAKYYIDLISEYEAIGQRNDAAELCRQLARVQLDEGYADSALSTLQRVREYATFEDDDYALLLTLYNATGHKREAVDVALRIGRQYLDAGNINAAEAVCLPFMESMPDHPDLCLFRARVARDKGNIGEAVSMYAHLARIHDLNGNIEGIIQTYRSILMLDPSRGDLRKEIEALQTSDEQRAKRRTYYQIALSFGVCLLAIIVLLFYTEISARQRFVDMQAYSAKELKLISALSDQQEQADRLKALYGRWSAFDPGWTVSSIQDRIDGEVNLVKTRLHEVNTSIATEHGRTVLSHRDTYEKAAALLESGDSEKRDLALSMLAELSSAQPPDEWVNHALVILKQDQRQDDAAQALFAAYNDHALSDARRREAALEILQRFPSSPYLAQIRLPVVLSVTPRISGTVLLNGAEAVQLTPEMVSATVWIPMRGSARIEIVAEGFRLEPWTAVDFMKPSLELTLQRAWIWQAEIGREIVSAPRIHGQTVYVANTSGTVRALHAATGKTLWTFPGERSQYDFRTTPFLQDQTLSLLENRGRLVRLQADSGQEEKLSAAVEPSFVPTTQATFHELPFLGGWFCLVGTTKGSVVCLSLKTGAVRWEYETGSRFPLEAPGAFANRALYFATQDGTVHQIREDGKPISLDSSSGKLFSFGVNVTSPLLATHDLLVAGLSNGELAAWRMVFPIRKAWSVTLRNGIVRAPLLIQGDMLYAGIESQPGEVHAIDIQSGAEQWQQRILPGPVRGNMAVFDDELIVPCGRSVVGLSRKDGSLLWTVELDGKVVTGVATNARIFSVATDTGRVYAFASRGNP